jgi:hypothetical protein
MRVDLKRAVARICWALLVLSLLTAVTLVNAGLGDALLGILLWPTVTLYATLTFLLMLGWLNGQRPITVTTVR